jgi:hypothetical protein
VIFEVLTGAGANIGVVDVKSCRVSTMRMKAAGFSQTLVHIYEATRCYIAEDPKLSIIHIYTYINVVYSFYIYKNIL